METPTSSDKADLLTHQSSLEKPNLGRLPNLRLVKQRDQLSAMFWRDHDGLLGHSKRFEGMRSRIANAAFVASHNCKTHQFEPALLPLPSKRALAWMHFLSAPAHLHAHLTSLKRLRVLSAEILPRKSASVIWQLHYSPSLYRLKGSGNGVLITINEAYLFADEMVWKALVHFLLGKRDKAERQIIRKYSASPEFSSVIDLLESPFNEVEAVGDEVDLEAVFLRVNNSCFNGALARPRLEWSRRKTRRQFGYYKPGPDILGISRTLDDASIPVFVIDFVMYHELLHKRLGIKEKNGRMIAHSRIFREAERAFPQYQKAQKWLKKLATEG